MNGAASQAIRLYGTEQPNPPLRTLRAGPLSVELDNGAIRYVRVGGIEVLRGIYFLVRDQNWGTATPVIDALEIDEAPDAFSVSYEATCTVGSGVLVYRARIAGRSDGTLSFEAEAEPRSDIVTNRTGFVVLHPIDGIAGAPVKVLHEDGSEELSTFPQFIDPKCPITDIRALSHEFAPGVWATCTMEGDAFEMEDQRNWSDASYKTYVRPLRRPWGYTLPKGQTFRQAIRLAISGPLPAAKPGDRGEQIRLKIGRKIGTVPRIGVGVSADEAKHALAHPTLVKRLAPHFLVCQVDLRHGHGRAELESYAALAKLTGAGIVLEIITAGTLDPLGELQPIAAAVDAIGLTLEAVTVFPAQDMVSMQPGTVWPEMPSFAETYSAARRAFPGVTLGGGMATYFTELNRKRPPHGLLDYATFTTCPSVHAADDVSVMETLQALPHMIGSARAFMDQGLRLRIGPSQLGCRENAYGKATTVNEANARLCLSRIDPRQRGLFTAVWSLGYFAACARSGIDAVALGGFTGPFGHIHRHADFVQPWYDGQADGALYPSFHIMAGLSQLAGADLLSVETSMPDTVTAIAGSKDRQTTLWIANVTSEKQSVLLHDTPPEARIVTLDAAAFVRAAGDPGFLEAASQPLGGKSIPLAAYAVVRIDLG